MIQTTPYSCPTIAPMPVNIDIKRLWIPSYNCNHSRQLVNIAHNTNGTSTNGDTCCNTLLLGINAATTAGAGPIISSGNGNGWPGISYDGSNDTASARGISNSQTDIGIDNATRATFILGFRRSAASTNGPAHGNSATGYLSGQILQVLSDGTIRMRFLNVSSTEQSGRFTSNDTKWHMVAFCYDGNQSTDATKLIGYLDGTPMSLTFSGSVPTSLAGSGGHWHVGYNPPAALFCTGRFNFAGIWGRTLKSSDVRYIYNEWLRGYPTMLKNGNFRRNSPVMALAPAGRLHYRSKLDGLGSGGQFYNNPLS
jgi:hypothetical protein